MGTVAQLNNSKKKAKSKGSKQQAKAAAAIGKLREHASDAEDPKVVQSAIDAITEIQKNWTKFREAQATQKKVNLESRDKLAADEAALQAAIEEELPASPLTERTSKGMKKLELVEMRWQEFQETKSANIEHKKAASERVKTWKEKFERAIGEASQLTLPNVG